MIARIATLIYGIASYLVCCSFLYAVACIGGYLVPRSIDVGSEGGLAQSILPDVALSRLFAVQRSVKARPKRWWTTIAPAQHLCPDLKSSSESHLLEVARPVVATIWHRSMPMQRVLGRR
jgi:hypothetical protein